MKELRHLHLRGAVGTVRTVQHQGREHIIVPVIALMEGVIHAVNAETPEFVPLATLQRAANSWNGRPVTLGHPTRGGRQCSANDPDIAASHGIGTVYNSQIKGKKLHCEAWIDRAKAEQLDAKMVERLLAGQMEEVSVGAFVVTDSTVGSYNGRQYKAAWLETTGDHLAFLPGGRGACSIEMGCGAHRAASVNVEGDEIVEIEESIVTPEEVQKFIAAIGARHSADDVAMIQEMHDRAVSLGADCVRALAKKKYKDCPSCGGSGNKDGNPCDACEGHGELKVHEEFEAAGCGCKGDSMKTKAERVTALVGNEHSPIRDQKILEGLDDKALDALETSVVTLKAAADKAAADKAAADKAAADLKAAEEKAKSTEDRLAAMETRLVTAEANQVTPEMKALVAEKQAQDDAEKTALVGTLKAAQTVYSEERLNGMTLAQLRETAQLVKVDPPADFSGRGLPAQPRAAAGNLDSFAPPDPYEAGLKALQTKH